MAHNHIHNHEEHLHHDDHCHHDEEHHHHEHCHGDHCHHEHSHDDGHHHHHHDEGKSTIVKIVIASLLLIVAVIIEKQFNLATWQMLLIFLVPYLIVGFSTLREAAEGIMSGQIFNEHFLMSIATIGALCIGFMPDSETQFPEAVFVMLFFQVGELFEGFAERRSRDSIAHLMDIRPDTATVNRNGEIVTIKPEEVHIGETIIVKPGEKIPIDAIITEGKTSLDTVALTGESMPREVEEGDEIMSGCVNLSGVITAQTIKEYKESTVTKIIQLVTEATEHKSHSESFISRFARVYTPIVVIAAVALALVPPLITLISGGSPMFSVWLYRALMFLVVSCPCALVISVPLSFFGGLGGASRRGILVKGANYIDILAEIDTVVFDKTGTLTHGRFTVEAVHPEKCDERRLLHLTAHVEQFSTHPVGIALRDAFPEAQTDNCHISDIKEIAGKGICAQVGDETVCVGNSKLMESVGAQWHDCHKTGTIIHVAINGEYAGHIVINDQIKPESIDTIKELRRLGVQRTVMLTGDRETVAADVASKVGIDEYHAQLLPDDKLHKLQEIHDSKTAFVGDGINDAPVLAFSDVGIAMGGLGSDAAIEAADVVIMDDDLKKLPEAILIARRTIRIARQNVFFAISVKVSVLLLAAFGWATMWMAVFADVGVTVLAVFNAMRTLKTKK